MKKNKGTKIIKLEISYIRETDEYSIHLEMNEQLDEGFALGILENAIKSLKENKNE